MEYGWTMVCYNPAFTLTDVAGSKKGYVLCMLVLVLKEYDDFFLLDGFSVLWRILTKKSYICLTLRTLGKKLCPVWEYGMLCIIRCPYTTNPGLAARLHLHFFLVFVSDFLLKIYFGNLSFRYTILFILHKSTVVPKLKK